MFKIGQKVFSKNSGVLEILAIEEKNFGVGVQKYFVLQPVFSYGKNVSKIFIPVDKADIQLRELLTKKEVEDLIKYMVTAERVWISDPKQRRQKFEEMYKTTDMKSVCQLIKSLHLQNEDLKLQKKSLSMLDRDFLDKMERDIHEEFSIVLGIEVSKIPDHINEHFKV